VLPDESKQTPAVPPELRAAIEQLFSDLDASVVAALLPTRDELPPVAEYERVLLSIVRLSEGKADRLEHFADVARRDWRDVVFWAESPRQEEEPSSWPELRRRLRLPEKP
jgi:hypothetical protein